MILFFLLFSWVAEGRSITPEDLGKVSSRELSSPFARQGSCLLFEYAEEVYCLSSYHVAYSAWNEEFEHSVTLADGKKSPLRWFASDWGRGMILLKLEKPPARKYLPWGEIPWNQEKIPAGAELSALGYPVNSDSLNEAYGQVVDEASFNQYPLFVYIDSFLLLRSAATEVGFSGGALLDEEGRYVGLLSHQVREKNEIRTVAIPAGEVKNWTGRHLETQFNRSFFYVEPTDLESRSYRLYIHHGTFRVQEFSGHGARIFYTPGANGFEDLVIKHVQLGQLDTLFPEKKAYELIACVSLWPPETIDDIYVFWRGVEPLRFLYRPDLFADYCGYYLFLRPGADGKKLGELWQKLIELWREHSPFLKEFPDWYFEWDRLMALSEQSRQDGDDLRGGNIPLHNRLYNFKLPLENESIQAEQEKIRQKFPARLRALENTLRELVSEHERQVFDLPYAKISSLPIEIPPHEIFSHGVPSHEMP